MKTLLVSLIFLTAMLSACKKTRLNDNVPECIKNNIETNKNTGDWGISSVDEYQYQGMVVYVYNPDMTYADAQASIVKSDCTILCSLGGITGNRMCNGEKFYDKALYLRTIWHK